MVRSLRRACSPFVTALALATLAGLLMEPLRPGSSVHVHWLGSGPLAGGLAGAFTVAVLARGPLERRGPAWLRRVAVLATGATALAAVRAAAIHEAAVLGDLVADDGSAPSASLLAALLLSVWTVVGHRAERPVAGVRARLAGGAAACAAAAVLVLAWVSAAGAVDQGSGRRADAIVVFGSKVGPDGRPSGSLLDRTVTACDLWRRGAAPVIVLAGGRSPSAPASEPEVMRRIAREHGVPDAALVLDETGLDTEATVRQAARLARERGWRRVLAVSHDYHLARIRLLGARTGLPLLTVPAHETADASWKRAAVLREVVAWTAAWLF